MTIGTKTQYAEYKGFSKAYLSKKDIKALLQPAMETDPADGKEKINFEKADELLAAHRDPAQPDRRGSRQAAAADPAPPEEGGTKFGDVKTQRETVKLENDMLNLLERKGETLSRREVIDACAAAGQKIQELTRSCSHRLAEKFATMSDAREIKSLMDEEFRRLLETVSDDLNRKFEPNGDKQSTAH